MTADRIVLRPATSDWPQAGEWKGLRLGGGRRSASVGCPECGQLAHLDDHIISKDGTVTPSLVCPYEGCSFHAFVRLEGWVP